MKSIKRASVLLSGILAALATVTAYSAADRETVPIVDPVLNKDKIQAIDPTATLPVEDTAVAEALGSGIIEYCPPGYNLFGPTGKERLCMTASTADINFGVFGSTDYRNAQIYCMNYYGGRVATPEDYMYSWPYIPGDFALPVGMWTGTMTGKNLVLVTTGSSLNFNVEANILTPARKFRCALGPNWH